MHDTFGNCESAVAVGETVVAADEMMASRIPAALSVSI
jgi:hypothetical protein